MEGSFWSVGFDLGVSSGAAIDEVLTKDNFTLEDLLDHDDIISECKYLNPDLIDFLAKPETVRKLIEYVIKTPVKSAGEQKSGGDEKKAEPSKHPYIASEIFACEVDEIIRTLFASESLLDLLFTFLNQTPPLNPGDAAYFCKTVVVLISKRRDELINFIRERKLIDALLRHIGLYSVMELLIRIGWDDGTGGMAEQPQNDDEHGHNAVDPRWLQKEQLAQKLVAKLHPDFANEAEVHVNASMALIDVVVKAAPMVPTANNVVDDLQSDRLVQQLMQHMLCGHESSLGNALAVFIVLVQSDTHRHTVSHHLTEDGAAPEQKDTNEPAPGPVIHHVANALGYLLDYLVSPTPTHATAKELKTQYGVLSPLFGQTRLKIVELVLALVTADLQELDAALIKHNVLAKVLDMFFLYPWNNMLHQLVEGIIHTILDLGGEAEGDEDAGEEEEERSPALVLTVRGNLKRHLFTDAKMIQKIVAGYKQCAVRLAQNPKDSRLGYMGYLIRISSALSQTLPDTQLTGELGLSPDELKEWKALTENELAEDVRKQQIQLGGHRPGGGSDDESGDYLDSFEFEGNSVGFEGTQGRPPPGGTSFAQPQDDEDEGDDFFNWNELNRGAAGSQTRAGATSAVIEVVEEDDDGESGAMRVSYGFDDEGSSPKTSPAKAVPVVEAWTANFDDEDPPVVEPPAPQKSRGGDSDEEEELVKGAAALSVTGPGSPAGSPHKKKKKKHKKHRNESSSDDHTSGDDDKPANAQPTLTAPTPALPAKLPKSPTASPKSPTSKGASSGSGGSGSSSGGDSSGVDSEDNSDKPGGAGSGGESKKKKKKKKKKKA